MEVLGGDNPPAPPPAADESIQELRNQARQVLVASAESGNLLDVLQKRNQEIVAAAPEEVSDLRMQAREALIRSAENGELTKLLQPKAAAVAAGPEGGDAKELADLKAQARSALVRGVEGGTLLSTLDRVKTPAGQEPAARLETPADEKFLKDRAREALINGADSGALLNVLLSADKEVTTLKDQAREFLAKGAESGGLLDALGGAKSGGAPPAPAAKAKSDELVALRAQAREALVNSAETGTLLDVLAKSRTETEPEQAPVPKPGTPEELTDLRRQARDVLVKGIESGSLLDVMAVARNVAPPEATPAPAPAAADPSKEEVANLKKQARDCLAKSAETGKLTTVLLQSKGGEVPATPEDDLADLKRQAREVLVKSAETGNLVDVLGKRPPTVPDNMQDEIIEINTGYVALERQISPYVARPESREQARLRNVARDVLLTAPDSKIQEALMSAEVPEEVSELLDLKEKALSVIQTGVETGDLLDIMAENTNRRLSFMPGQAFQPRASYITKNLPEEALSASLEPLEPTAEESDNLIVRARQVLCDTASSGALVEALQEEFKEEKASTIIKRDGTLVGAMKRMTTEEFRQLREEAKTT
jgi:hypothetical protein